MDLAPIYLQRVDVLADVIGNVKTDQLGDSTPCADFDVRALINHVLGDTLGLALAAKGETVDLQALIGPNADYIAEAGGDMAAAAARVRDVAREAWSQPGVTDKTFQIGDGMPGKLAQRIALIEAVLHGWDIAKATNQSYSIPDQLAEPMLSGLKQAVGDDRPSGGAFGPPVPVPADASLADQLVAYTGRTP